ncbi:hypothetical protein AAY473_012886 [Plecturocebus cupreus]
MPRRQQNSRASQKGHVGNLKGSSAGNLLVQRVSLTQAEVQWLRSHLTATFPSPAQVILLPQPLSLKQSLALSLSGTISSAVAQSRLTITPAFWVQAILLPQPPDKDKIHYVGQAGLKLLTSGDTPVSASQSARITGMSHHVQPCSVILTVYFACEGMDMDESGNHQSQQTDTRTENQTLHVLTHRHEKKNKKIKNKKART